MARITGVTFDLWQTLLMDNREQGRARARVRIEGAIEALALVGRSYGEDHIRKAYGACYRTCHAIREEERDVSFRDQVGIFIEHIEEGLLKQLPRPIVQEITDAYSDSFFVYPPTAHRDAPALLKEVKSGGYAVALISNTGMTPGYTFRAFLEQLDLMRYFDTLIFSDEVLLAKPSREIFQRTMDAIGSSPEETVHVGDHLANDVLGAKQAGMRTIWIETYEDGREPVEVRPDLTVQTLGEVGSGLRRMAEAAS